MKKYDSYKESGVEWIGEVPSKWGVIRLKFPFHILPSNVDKKTVEGEPEVMLCNYVDVYKNTYITTEIDYMRATASEAQIAKLSLKKGDVIATKDSEDPNDIGIPALVKENLEGVVCGYHLTMLKPKVEEWTGDYLFWIMSSKGCQQYFATEARGITRYAIGTNAFSNLQLPKPSFSEQTVIANYLDHKTTQIDHLIAKKEQFIQLLEEERVAVINQAVTKGLDPTVPMKYSGIEWLGEIPAHWEVKKLKQVFNSSKGLTITKENLEDEGIPCVNYGEIHSKFGFEVDIDKHQLRCVNPTYLESDYKSLIKTGDFVFADTSEDVSGAGNFTYLKSNHEIFAGYHTIILRATCDIESRYFAYQFDCIPYRTQIRQSVKGIKVFSITQGILKNTSLWIPTLDEQKQIIKFLDIETDRIMSIKHSTRKEIELLKEYKTALISEVVTGKVDVRDEKLN